MNLLHKSDPSKGISVLSILIYLAVFSVSGYLSYRFILSSHLDELKSVRIQYDKEKSNLESEVEKAREIAKLNFNVQRLEKELYEINGRLFAENEVLAFMRMLPEITRQTETNLMSLVPSETRIVQTQTSKESNANTANQPNYKLKPIDVVIIGDYTDIIRFFEQIEQLNRYITVSSLNMSNSGDNASKINVKLELNLVQMDIDPELLNKMPNLQLVKGTQPANKAQLPNYGQNTAKSADIETQPTSYPEKKIVSKTMPTAPTQVAKQVNNAPSTQLAKSTTIEKKTVQPVGVSNTIKQTLPNQPVKNTQDLAKAKNIITKPVNNSKPNNNVASNVAKVVTRKERYTVQVGIFVSQDNANNLVNLLKSHKYEPWIKHGYVSSEPAYYIYVGNFATESEARSLGRNMNSKLPFIKYYYIVKNIYQIEGDKEKIKDSIIIE